MRKAAILLILIALGYNAGARTVKVRSTAAFQRAIDEARPGDRIILRKGVYRLTDTLVISGKHDLVIEGRGAQINGGIRIRKRQLKRCKEVMGSPAPKGLRMLDISRLPVSGIVNKGHTHPSGPSWSQFYADGTPMHLSEWPNGRSIPLDSVVRMGVGRLQGTEGPGYGIIAFKEDRPLEWADPTLGWLAGCFRFGWSDEMVTIKEIRPDKTLEVAQQTAYGFGFRPGESFQKWKVLNIPEEVDEPSEYAMDIENGRAWLMLPRRTRHLELGLQRFPLMVVRDCKGLTIKGLDFAYSCGDGMFVTTSEGVLIEDCEMHNLGHVAVKFAASCRDCGVRESKFYNLGAGGIHLAGGDRKHVVRGDNYVEDCIFHDFDYIEKHYRPAVTMSGIGNRISRCEFYDSPSCAVLMLGNDQLVEYCNIHHVCMDVEDNGALYHGRNPSQCGSVIRYNYFHDILVPFNVRATYHDDGSGWVEAYGNIFDRFHTAPTQMGGGSHIVYHDNIYMNLDGPAIKIDARLQTWGADRLIAHRDSVALVDGPEFRAHYPGWGEFVDRDYSLPESNVLIRTVFYNVKWAFERVIWSDHYYNDDISGSANFVDEMHDNWKTCENPGFVDPSDPLRGFVADPAVLRIIPGFQLPQVEKIPPTSVSHYRVDGGFSGGDDEAHTSASMN